MTQRTIQPRTRQSIPVDLRRLVIRHVIEEGNSVISAASTFNISVSSVRRFIKKHINGERIGPKNQGGARNTVLSAEIANQIHTLMLDNNIYYLHDLKRILDVNVHESTIWRWLKKLNYSYKLIRNIPIMRNDEGVKNERIEYVEAYMRIPLNYRYRNLIYIAESPFNLHIVRSHGYSKVGTTPNQIVSNSRGANVTMIIALDSNNIVLSEAIVGVGVTAVIFKEFLLQLKRVLGEDEEFTLVMDNVRFHHALSDFYDTYPYNVIFLPRYSPFLNPCEETFSAIKSHVRLINAALGTNELIERMVQGCQNITTEHLSAFINHCEQFFSRCLNRENIER
jgi:transposase